MELLERAGVPVAQVGVDGRLLSVGSVLAELLGRERTRLVGAPLGSLLHPDDPAVRGHLELTGFAETGPGPDGARRVLLHVDGSAVPVDVHQCLLDTAVPPRWVAVVRPVTDPGAAPAQAHRDGLRDELTGLPGRAAVVELLAQRLAAGPEPGTLAVLLCDVDRFRRVNDSLGHPAGDELLALLGRALAERLRPCCVPGRLSGDEFVVLCGRTDTHGGVAALAGEVAALLRRRVQVGGHEVQVSASVGGALASPGSSPTDLLRRADAAAGQARRSGPGRTVVDEDLAPSTPTHEVRLESELRAALRAPTGAGTGLQVHYQPVVAADGRVLSAEALLRWHHPRLGVLLPGQLLPVAERGALLGELDKWVLHTAATEACGWPEPVGLAVNLSGIDPGAPDFVAAVSAAVEPTGLPWNRLTLELVETRLVDLPERARTAMRVLTARGASFAVDDFGTGHSSLARFAALPVQVVKVDRTVVAGVAVDPADFAVVRAVVELARAMGRTCVAEGVETVAQLQVLRAMGVDGYQGWLFCRAVDATGLRELLAHGRVDPVLPRSPR